MNVDLTWLKKFEKEKGRPLRVLHVGNIANNGYLNAKYQRKVGIEADVLCGNYFHTMASPEWEEIYVTEYGGDDFNPIFSKKDKQGYKRPLWFAQGSFIACCDYLRIKQKGHRIRAAVLRMLLLKSNDSKIHYHLCTAFGYIFTFRFNVLYHSLVKLVENKFLKSRKNNLNNLSEPTHSQTQNIHNSINSSEIVDEAIFVSSRPLHQKIKLYYKKLPDYLSAKLEKIILVLKEIPKYVSAKLECYIKFGLFFFSRRRLVQVENNLINFENLLSDFNHFFPERPDKLTIDDIMIYTSNKVIKDLVPYYDVFQCYGVEPIWAALTDIKPYVAFEHGTLRAFAFEPTSLNRLNVLAYRKAQHVFVTNGDCLENVHKLGIENYSGIAHPIEGDWIENETILKKIRKKYNAEVLIFSPMRHDWDIKGNDVVIKAIPLILKKIKKRVVIVFTRWGQEVPQSIHLIESIGCSNNVEWTLPLCRKYLVEMMQAADIILDQMILPCFGGIVPQALSVGTPVVMSYKPESTEWIFKEPPPVLSAFTSEEIADAVVQSLDPAWKKDYKKKALHWFQEYHHMDRIVEQHLSVYERVIRQEESV